MILLFKLKHKLNNLKKKKFPAFILLDTTKQVRKIAATCLWHESLNLMSITIYIGVSFLKKQKLNLFFMSILKKLNCFGSTGHICRLELNKDVASTKPSVQALTL